MTTELRTVDPRTDPAWLELANTPSGSVFSSPPWFSAIADTYGFDVAANVLFDGDSPRAGLAYTELDDFLGNRLLSLPFCDYLDPFLTGDEAQQDVQWNELVDPLLARGFPFQIRVLDTETPRRDPRLVVHDEMAWHCTDLTREEDEILAGLDRRARQNIRAAERHGVTVRFGSDLEDAHAFHDLHRHTRKNKHRLLAQPVSFFENIWKAFAPTDSIVVGFAIHQGEVIAASFYLVWGDVWYYKFSASIFDRSVVRPNELLAWESFKLARSRGCRYYDWGVSDLDQPGLVSYKRKLASEERRVTILRHTPPGFANPKGAEAGGVLGELTQLLTRDDVPDEVTKRAGEILYRYFT